MRKHFVQDDYFDNVDTAEKAYWLGFIAADGCVSDHPSGKGLEIGLAIKDKEHLENLKKIIGGSLREKRQSVVLKINSVKIFQALLAIGLTPRKSLTCQPWIGPDELMPHYWRGIIDGDGHIKFVVDNICQTRICLVGTFDMCQAFCEFVKCKQKPIKRASENVWRVNIGGLEPTQNILQKLKYDSCPSLDRKKIIALTILEQIKEQKITKFQTQELKSLYAEFNSWENVAKHLSVSRNGLYKHLRRLGIKRRKWKKKETTEKTLRIRVHTFTDP